MTKIFEVTLAGRIGSDSDVSTLYSSIIIREWEKMTVSHSILPARVTSNTLLMSILCQAFTKQIV